MAFPRLRFLVPPGLALVGLLAASTLAVSAHAQYSSSTPAANGTVSAVPSTLQITFTQEQAFIQIQVTGPDGSNVTTGPATFDLNQRHNASVPLRDAGPGQYAVLWHNVSGDDGDPNDGAFVFTEVAPTGALASPTLAPAASPTPAPSAPTGAGAPSAQPTATPAPTAPTCSDNGQRTAGINDVRADTYCKRQAIRDKYAGQIDVLTFNDALAMGEGLESALADARAAKSGGGGS